MEFKRTVSLLATFARPFIPAMLVVTAAALWLTAQFGTSILALMFWFKAATSAMIFYVVDQLKKKEYFYYRNLGLSRRRLWWSVTVVDFLLFLLSSALTLTLR